ncbi:MAG: pilus assembly protein PilM [Microbacterium sp.]|nr:pilus assembly protein PilM [Microbacterium sp.]
MAKTQVAVEITETSVRAVEVSVGRAPMIVAAGEVPLPEGAAKDSEILDRDAVAVALQRLWADARISSREVVLGVGNRRILVREHSTQLTNPVHIRQSLPFEVQDRLPVPVDQAVLDFVPTRQDDRGVHGLLVAAVAEHMEELVGALEQAKLRATTIDLVAFGQARALSALGGPEQTGLFLGIGEHTTHIVIATGGIPRFVRVVPIDIVAPAPTAEERRVADEAGAASAAAASVATPVPVEPVEPAPAVVAASRAAYRRGRSADTGEYPAGPAAAPAAPPAVAPEPAPIPEAAALHPAVQAALIDMVGRLRSTVTFYRDRPDAVPIDVTWVAGAHAAHPRLLEAIAKVVETAVLPVAASGLIAPSSHLVLPPDVDARLAGTASLLLGGAR